MATTDLSTTYGDADASTATKPSLTPMAIFMAVSDVFRFILGPHRDVPGCVHLMNVKDVQGACRHDVHLFQYSGGYPKTAPEMEAILDQSRGADIPYLRLTHGLEEEGDEQSSISKTPTLETYINGQTQFGPLTPQAVMAWMEALYTRYTARALTADVAAQLFPALQR